MIKVGITGGIGTGKTLVAEIFSRLGVPVFNADAEAAVITRSAKVLTALKRLFGDKILEENGMLNRNELRTVIFNDQVAREQVNRIIHPLVKERFDDWCLSHDREPFILKEAAILFESGAHTGLDKIIVVASPEKLRIQRVMLRDGTDEQEVRKIIAGQMDEKEKLSMANYKIINDEQQLIVPQVLNIFSQISKIAGSGTTCIVD